MYVKYNIEIYIEETLRLWLLDIDNHHITRSIIICSSNTRPNRKNTDI